MGETCHGGRKSDQRGELRTLASKRDVRSAHSTETSKPAACRESRSQNRGSAETSPPLSSDAPPAPREPARDNPAPASRNNPRRDIAIAGKWKSCRKTW